MLINLAVYFPHERPDIHFCVLKAV